MKVQLTVTADVSEDVFSKLVDMLGEPGEGAGTTADDDDDQDEDDAPKKSAPKKSAKPGKGVKVVEIPEDDDEDDEDEEDDEDDEDETPAPKKTAKAMTIEAVKKIVIPISKAGKKEKIVALLKTYKAANLDALKPQHYAEFVAKVQKLK